MVDRLKRAAISWPVFWVALVYLTARVVIWAWPVSWFLEVNSVFVFDGPENSEVSMQVDRTIHRQFYADWFVVVRQYKDGAGWEAVCTGQGSGAYIPEAVLPLPLTLDWWTEGSCTTLPLGRYFISTVWEIQGNGLLSDKFIHTRSNVFTVARLGPDGALAVPPDRYDPPPLEPDPPLGN